ncbi:ABC transporter [Pseudoalteromonas sp. SMS1]|uniref:lipocalin-like domain-containing protein n=1 Tax=Pseudoalteromonas sp. SMS1 TaxID=2908894 RepID=UPI001F44609E|nr:lipocalin-like domain-containing protein [Pseudoalteromonas sp. SMS1]MCF2857115.1 ABC transporter [Pseudoalteromonas sp. SMS1]
MKSFALCIISAVLLVLGCSEQSSSTKSQFSFSQQIGDDVEPDTQLTFPQDHGIHPSQGIEWWYITANLESESKQQFGAQWTLFRVSTPNLASNHDSIWWDGQFYFAHFALQTNESHVAFERTGRAGSVKVNAAPFTAQIKDWHLSSIDDAYLPLRLQASESGYRVDLVLDNSPRVLHGKSGYSQKTQDGHASMYYSYPFLQARGRVEFAGETHQVTGRAWLDREWSSAFINPNQMGWDWFSLQAKDTSEGGLMAFCIRGAGQNYEYCSATSISPDGQSNAYDNEQVSLKVLERITLEGKDYPRAWQLNIDGFTPIEIQSINPDSRNNLSIPYWEGRVQSRGGFDALGYGELVGY